MRLLILTQKVDQNDSVLGFMHAWIKEFARQAESVKVICLEKHSHSLPQNVEVLSLGKEEGRSKFKYIVNFYTYIWGRRHEYDAVFVHMNHEYVVLGGIIWKMLGKKVALWYAHGHVSFTLRIAHVLSDVVFTSGKSGFRIPSGKVRIVGQGIDTEQFTPGNPSNSIFSIITVGRITPSKDYETLVKALGILKSSGQNFAMKIIGSSDGRKGDLEYEKQIKELTINQGVSENISFLGAVPNKDLPGFLKNSDLFVNMGQTGSIDKVVLEAMAAGLGVLTCNEAFLPILEEYKERLMYPKRDPKILAEKIKAIIETPKKEREDLGKKLREIIVKDHNLQGLIRKIVAIIQNERI